MLFAMLFAVEAKERNEAPRSWALDLFVDCLRAVRGEKASDEMFGVPMH